jgi:putative DNA primase/helicase
VSGAADTPDMPPEVLAALARLNAKHFQESCAAFAAILGVTSKALRTAVLETQKDLKNELPFEVHLPSETPVSLAEHLSAVASFVRRFIIVSPEQADAVALWIAFTYTWESAEHAPLLIINAPERSCGKTTLQNIAVSLSQRAMGTANATPSTLYRLIESLRPTVFIDEADTFLGNNGDLHGLINSGHSRGRPIWRTEAAGDSFVVKSFDVFCPKSLAGIALEKHLTDATMSRGIVINMRKRLDDEPAEDWGRKHRAEAAQLARGFAWIAVNQRDAIEQASPSLPDELNDRDQDNWLPLFAIAQCAGPEWETRAAQAARRLAASTPQPESISHELLHDIRIVVQRRQERLSKSAPAKTLKFITTQDLHDALTLSQEFTWGAYNRGEPITFKQLARQLSPYGIRPKTVRMPDGTTPKGYEVRYFKDAFDRYLKKEEVEELADDQSDDSPGPKPPQGPHEPPQADSAH